MSSLSVLRRVSALLFCVLVLGANANAQKPPPKPPELTPGQKAGAYILLKVESGTKAYEQENYKQAVADLSEALRLQPTNARALLYRGKAYNALEDWDRAIADFSDLIKADPKDAVAYHWRGTAYKEKAEPRNDMRLYDLALADLSKAQELEPTGSGSYSYRICGYIYRLKKDYERALVAYSQAITLEPKNARGHESRGHVYYEKKDYDRAIRDYSTAIELNPQQALTFNLRGDCYRWKRQLEPAIADYSAAIKLEPLKGAFYRDRGCAYLEQKSYDEVIADATRALQLEPKDSVSWIIRGNAYHRVKAYERALVNYAEVIKLDPRDASGYGWYAWLCATCPEARYRDGKKALEYATKARELVEGKADDWLETLAAAYAENGRFDDAVKWQKMALKQLKDDDPTLEEARLRLKLYEEKKPFRE